MSRLNTTPFSEAPVRTRQPRRPTGPSPEIIDLAREAFLANKQANAATALCNASKKALGKAMAKAGITEFEFRAPTPTGGEVAARAAIEPFTKDVIDVAILRTLVDDKTFMAIVKASQTAVKEEAGEHVCNKALVTEECPAELKIREIK